MSASKTNFDVLVIGAGIVGQSMALGLAKQGLQVAVVDKSDPPLMGVPSSPSTQSAPEFSSRVSAISAASQALLEELGAWQHLARKQAYNKMQVWDKDGFGEIIFDAEERKELQPQSDDALYLGHIIENDQINAALFTALQDQENATCFYNCDVDNLKADAESVQLVIRPLADPKQKVLSAKLLIGADGANSRVRQSCGFKQTFWDYDHNAIVANVTTELPHGQVARQAFTPFGPLAFLPLPDPFQSSIVFSQQSMQAERLMALSDSEFEKALLVAIDGHYGKCELNTQRQSFPLRMRYARQWTGTRVALIGDAAHTIHPLAGQGANLGLSDVKALLEKIKNSSEPVGHSRALRQYERQQKAEALKVIATMEGFKRLFDGEQAFVKFARNLGLVGAHNIPVIKRFFMQQAMG